VLRDEENAGGPRLRPDDRAEIVLVNLRGSAVCLAAGPIGGLVIATSNAGDRRDKISTSTRLIIESQASRCSACAPRV
jgi:hypothetical protein